MSKSAKELTELAKNFNHSPEEVIKMWKRVKEYNDRLKIQEALRTPSQDFLNRTYTL